MNDLLNQKTNLDTLCGKCGKTLSSGSIYYFGEDMARRLGTPTGIICPRCLGLWAKEEMDKYKSGP
jgi:hypothetical protein